MDSKVQHIINIIAQKENEISLLKAALENSTPIDTVDLTRENTAKENTPRMSLNNQSSKRQRTGDAPTKSNLAFAHEKIKQ